MSLMIEPEVTERIPLRSGEHGVILLADTRVPLDTVVYAYNAGQSAEEIVLGYPTLQLADVYAVIAYYLRHRDAVDAYVSERRGEIERLRERIEAHADARGIRQRLLARRLVQ
jgi:uncharacterized protein (DUF433 family)